MRFKEYINESIIDIDKRDIDLIYKPLNKFMRKISANVKSKNINALKKVLSDIRKIKVKTPQGENEMWILKSIKSTALKSINAREANKIKPIHIFVGFLTNQPFYSPHKEVILVGPTLSTLDFFTQPGMLKDIEDKNVFDYFENMATELNIKTIIRHELTHWIDDVLHNLFLTKSDNLTGGGENIIKSYEIQAIIHQVDEIRKQLGYEKYNELTWDEFMKKVPDIRRYIRHMDGFFQKFIKRMMREKFLTDKMYRTMGRLSKQIKGIK